jgi:hypothetical protein
MVPLVCTALENCSYGAGLYVLHAGCKHLGVCVMILHVGWLCAVAVVYVWLMWWSDVAVLTLSRS